MNTLVSLHWHYPLLCQQPHEHHKFFKLFNSNYRMQHSLIYPPSLRSEILEDWIWERRCTSLFGVAIFFPIAMAEPGRTLPVTMSFSPWAAIASTVAPREQGTALQAQLGWVAERQSSNTGEANSIHGVTLWSDRSVTDKFGQLQS